MSVGAVIQFPRPICLGDDSLTFGPLGSPLHILCHCGAEYDEVGPESDRCPGCACVDEPVCVEEL